jgi:hypothetical protein
MDRGNDGRGGGIDFWGENLCNGPYGVRIHRWCGSRDPGESYLGKIGL